MPESNRTRPAYPIAKVTDVVDSYHGTLVKDPYRWLEDPDSAETHAWVEAQQRLSADYLAALPYRDQIRARLTALTNYPKYYLPRRRGAYYFFQMNEGLQNQPPLYRMRGLNGKPEIALDANALSEDGTIALWNWQPNRDGGLLAYATSASGGDLLEIRVRDLETGRDYDEVLRWCRFTFIAWKDDSSGFFYNRYPEPGSVPPEDTQAYNRLYWHRLGTPQAEDVLIYERPDDKELLFLPTITEDGRYLILQVQRGAISRNRIYYREVESDGPFTRLIDELDAAYDFIGNIDTRFYFVTTAEAPRGRVIAIDIEAPDRQRWQEIIPESDGVLQTTGGWYATVHLVHGRLIVPTMRDAQHHLLVYSLEGQFEREIALPAPGTVIGLSGRSDDRDVFIWFTSFLYPPTILRYSVDTGTLGAFQQARPGFDPANYTVRQVFFTSKDGASVPMFIVYHNRIVLNEETPILMYGYGGFGLSLTPDYTVLGPNSPLVAWLEKGGVFAVVNLRGGSEYGEAWHETGMLDRKQTVFDDFIAAGEWLIANHYTSTRRLAIMGASNGGLLVSACMLQRPDLFGAVICQVPVVDMLRYHRFTAGRYWVPEYGNAEEDPAHFRFLYAYSPVHNVRPGTVYPPTLILTADHDDRVVPMHSFKLAAALQTADRGTNPLLLRVETKAGHGVGKATSKEIDEVTDIFAFLFDVFGMEG